MLQSFFVHSVNWLLSLPDHALKLIVFRDYVTCEPYAYCLFAPDLSLPRGVDFTQIFQLPGSAGGRAVQSPEKDICPTARLLPLGVYINGRFLCRHRCR